MSDSPAADALAAARKNLKELEEAAKLERLEKVRQEKEERESARGIEVKDFQDRNYDHTIGGISDYIGVNGLIIDFVEYTTVKASRALTTNEGYALYSALEDVLAI